MSGGVFAVSRGIFDHPLFAAEPFSEREAWMWLIGEAAWKPRRVRVGSKQIDLRRGQLAFSTRFMASKWQWSEARVRRFLGRLKNDAMIDAQADAHATQITICKYDEYQKVALPTDAPPDAPNDADATQTRRKLEDREIREITTEDSASAPDPVEVVATLTEAAGSALDPTSPSLHVATKPLAWIGGGADMRLDIIPTVKRLSAKAKPRSIRDWEYFRGAVIEARDGRLAGLPAFVPVVGTVNESEPVIWVPEDHPDFKPFAARLLAEKGTRAYGRGSRSESGLGWHFPKRYQDTAPAVAAA